MIEARHAELGRHLALAAHIDLAGRIVADQHGRQAGLGTALGDQLGHALAHALRAGRRRTPCRRSVSLQPSPLARSRIHWPIRSASEAGSPAMLTVLSRAVGAAHDLEGGFRQPPFGGQQLDHGFVGFAVLGGRRHRGLERAVRRRSSAARRARGWTRKLDRHARAGAAQERRIGRRLSGSDRPDVLAQKARAGRTGRAAG